MLSQWRSSFATLIALCFPLLSGCRQAEEPPNVVLIVIDTLRADRFEAYGGAPEIAPFLNHLGSTGTVCTQTYSASSWTAPAMASMMTALHPLQHGVQKGFLANMKDQGESQTIALDRVPGELETLAESLQLSGYRTFAVTDNRNICSEMGFDQGFDRFHNMNHEGAKALQSKVMEWQPELRKKGPYFLYLHFMDPHRPYRHHDPGYAPVGKPRLDQLAAYNSEVDHVDRTIQQLYKELGWDQNTVLVVTADHGEEFLDHGGWDHGRTLYQEVLAVPLFWIWPGGGAPHDPAAKAPVARCTDPVSLMDIAPTLRDYLHLPPQPAQGVSLLPALEGRGPLPARMIGAHV
ncbi:MAG: sulfatase, partial [Planctomycetota bacterium]